MIPIEQGTRAGFDLGTGKFNNDDGSNILHSCRFSNQQEYMYRRFEDACINLPRRGGGCHPALLGAANRGVAAGLTDNDIFMVVRVHADKQVPDQEIWDAVEKARADTGKTFCIGTGHAQRWSSKQPEPKVKTVEELLIDCGGPIDPCDADLWESSPVRLDWHHTQDMIHLLDALYEPEDFVYIGILNPSSELQRRSVKTVKEWIRFFSTCNLSPKEMGERFSRICLNPISKLPVINAKGKPSWRCDTCVVSHRLTLVEFDTIAKAKQIAIQMHLFRNSLACLIDSGDKSVHAWVKVDAVNVDEWTRVVENKLFAHLALIGVDDSCRNEGRLSRLPGVLRPETGQYQRLLWLRGKAGVA